MFDMFKFKMSKARKMLIVLMSVFAVVIPVLATGNGAPSGAHYNLNIIGCSKEKAADMTASDGHVIFVPLVGKVEIKLSEGEFKVLDANGTDGKAAFQLPNPDPTNSGITKYSVYVRALAKPGGKADITPYIVDPLTGDTYYSAGSVSVERVKGKSTFTNVSKELLYVYADINADGIIERTPLFGNAAYEYFWNYDNKGLKHAQLRFYEVSTNVN